MSGDGRGPRIGATMELTGAPAERGGARVQLDASYLRCLRAAGAVPVLLPADASPDEAADWLDGLDGLLLTGGADVDLRLLGGPDPLPECQLLPPPKQELDFWLVAAALRRELPVLGICLGMQVLGLAHRSELIQHLPNDAAGHRGGVRHVVRPAPGTRLARIVGTGPFQVVSSHHQALRAPGPGLVGAAWSDDGVLEALERPDLSFTLGVQWHPERQGSDVRAAAIFSSFAAAARSYRESGAVRT